MGRKINTRLSELQKDAKLYHMYSPDWWKKTCFNPRAVADHIAKSNHVIDWEENWSWQHSDMSKKLSGSVSVNTSWTRTRWHTSWATYADLCLSLSTSLMVSSTNAVMSLGKGTVWWWFSIRTESDTVNENFSWDMFYEYSGFKIY